VADAVGDAAGGRAGGRPGAGDPAAARRLEDLYDNLADFIELARRERHHLEGLERSVGQVPVVRVPLLEVEVCDISSLTEVGRYLLAAASDGRTGAG
jgi:hypothetical protein